MDSWLLRGYSDNLLMSTLQVVVELQEENHMAWAHVFDKLGKKNSGLANSRSDEASVEISYGGSFLKQHQVDEASKCLT